MSKHTDHSADLREKLTRNLARIEAQRRHAVTVRAHIGKQMAARRDHLVDELGRHHAHATNEMGHHSPEDLADRAALLQERRVLDVLGDRSSAEGE